jgi:hypothetical protein
MLKRYPIDLTRAHIMLAADEHETDAENASGGCSSQAGRRLKQGDVTLTGSTGLYSSRKNRVPRKISDVACAKTSLTSLLIDYTQFM